MKKMLGLALATVLFLAGCGGKTVAPASAAVSSSPASAAPQSRQPAAPKTLTITFSNSSSYIFNEIYISPTAANDWGDDLLGSTRILKANGSLEFDIPAYDFDNYDILVVDEDRDEYHFTRVPLQNGNEVSIYFGDAGLTADVYDAKGTAIATEYGTLEGSYSGDPQGESPQEAGWIEFGLVNSTSHIVFTDVYFMPEGTTNEADIGYNHIASVAPLNPGDHASIGVDDHVYFDVLLLGDNGSEWYFPGVHLQADCIAYPTNHNGIGFTVEYANGSKTDYLGELYT